MLMGLMDEFNFGKYKGYTVNDVIKEDPDYIRWCIENIDDIVFTEEVEVLL